MKRQFSLSLILVVGVSFAEAVAANPPEDPQPQPTTVVVESADVESGDDDSAADDETPRRLPRRRPLDVVEFPPIQPHRDYLGPSTDPVSPDEERRATVNARSPDDPPPEEGDQGPPTSSSGKYPVDLIMIASGLVLIGILFGLLRHRPSSLKDKPGAE